MAWDVQEIIRKVWPEWTVQELIGRGGYGQVFRAVRSDLAGTSYAAIKVLQIPRDEDELLELQNELQDTTQVYTYFRQQVEEIVSEIKNMIQVKGHPNLVSIDNYYIYQESGKPHWVILIRMELLKPLRTALPERTLTDKEILKIGIDLCQGLSFCHRKDIIHRDIKPANIFVNSNGDYQLGDFGVARTVSHRTHFTRIGTPGYMAPELYTGQDLLMDSQAAAKVDQYSLGLVLYWLANNRKMPFQSATATMYTAEQRRQAMTRRLEGEKLPPPEKVSGLLAQVILKACEYKPEDRFNSVDEMLREMTLLQEGKTLDPPADPGNGVGTGMGNNRKNPGHSGKRTAIIAGAGAGAAILITLILFLNRPELLVLSPTEKEILVEMTVEPIAGTVSQTEAAISDEGEVREDETEQETMSENAMEETVMPGGAAMAMETSIVTAEPTAAPTQMSETTSDPNNVLIPETVSLEASMETEAEEETAAGSESQENAEKEEATEEDGKVAVFALKEKIGYDRGTCLISWTDGAQNGPYEVRVLCCYGEDEMIEVAVDTVNEREFRTTEMIPGGTYQVRVTDADGTTVEQIMEMPAESVFVDGDWKASSISAKYKAVKVRGRKTSDVGTLRAKEMVENLQSENYWYGFEYEIALPKLVRARDFFMQLVFEAPNGFREEDSSMKGRSDVTYYDWEIVGGDFFDHLFYATGGIPAGEYSMKLFINGMLARTDTFRIMLGITK